MTTTMTLATRRAKGYRISDVMRSEWTKFQSLRSVKWTMTAFVLLSIALGIVSAAVSGSHWARLSPSDKAAFDPTNQSLTGLAFGMLAIGVLGVLVMTNEYSSGAIRSTLTAVPRRRLLLTAKAAVYGVVSLAVGEVVTFTMFLAGQATMGNAPHATLGQPGVLRAVALSGGFLCLIGLFGLGLGAIIRQGAGAITAFAACMLAPPLALGSLPGHIVKFTPEGILQSSVAAARTQAHQLTPWVGFALMAVYAGLALAVGGAALARRDA